MGGVFWEASEPLLVSWLGTRRVMYQRFWVKSRNRYAGMGVDIIESPIKEEEHLEGSRVGSQGQKGDVLPRVQAVSGAQEGV